MTQLKNFSNNIRVHRLRRILPVKMNLSASLVSAYEQNRRGAEKGKMQGTTDRENQVDRQVHCLKINFVCYIFFKRSPAGLLVLENISDLLPFSQTEKCVVKRLLLLPQNSLPFRVFTCCIVKTVRTYKIG